MSVKTQERSGVITIGSSAASTVKAWPTGGAGWRKASASTATQAAGSEKMISATAAVANTLRLKPRVRSQERPKASNALLSSSSTTTWVVSAYPQATNTRNHTAAASSATPTIRAGIPAPTFARIG